MRPATHLALLAAVCPLLGAVEVRAGSWGGSLGAASDNVFRGISQSGGNISGRADLHYLLSQWYAGLSAASLRRTPGSSTTAGLIAFGGYARRIGDDWTLGMALRHYEYPWNTPHQHYDYDEASLSLGWRDRISLRMSASPDTCTEWNYRGHGLYYSRSRAAFSYEVAAHQALSRDITVNAGGGYYDLQHQVGAGYVYWNAGLSRSWGSWHVDLDYIGTDARGRHLFGDAAVNRVVLGTAWLF